MCEGKKTEPKYFKAIREKHRLTSVTVYDSQKTTAKELVGEAVTLMKEAKKDRNEYDEVWVVVDRDDYTKHPQSFDKARANRIKIAFSSTCFEYWLLLHFEYTTSPFTDCDNLIGRLKGHIANYEKSLDCFALIEANTSEAIVRCSRVMKHWEDVSADQPIWEFNPYTNVGELVEMLISLNGPPKPLV